MAEAKPPRVQHLAREIFSQTRRVNLVSEDRVTEKVQVHADLMGAPAVQPALN